MSNIPEFSVTELSMALKRTLEDGFARVRVRGELSKVKIHTSGHLYSDLKDSDCLINIVCWRAQVAKLSIRPEEGLEVICTGKITSYPARSNYQMLVESMELAGAGALLKMLDDRRKKLAAEGLFDAARKKPLPFLPRIVGVVTSPTGAVIKDILHRLSDRCPCHVILYPVKVQGEGASVEITSAINYFNTMTTLKPDVLIVGRGGGSLEDLMVFNEENVVRAIAASVIPIVSAVGHETDTTLADYAADMRAPTPTAAAEMIMPERLTLLSSLTNYAERIQNASLNTLTINRHKIANAKQALGDPLGFINQKSQSLDHLTDQLIFSARSIMQSAQLKLSRFKIPSLKFIFDQLSSSVQNNYKNLGRILKSNFEKREHQLQSSSRMLSILSYQAVLDRGFALLQNAKGEVISSENQLKTGEIITISLKDGKKNAEII
jgi:exodeoxyribonuclease VII large subunit